jgi:coatomer subunit alpha
MYFPLNRNLLIEDPLAYATAKSHGLTEECSSILEEAGVSEDEIALSSSSFSPLTPLRPIATMSSNWPLLPSSRSLFESALGDEITMDAVATSFEELLREKGPNGVSTTLMNMESDNLMDEENWENHEETAGGWAIDDEEEDEIVDTAVEEAPVQSVPDSELWVLKSPLAAHHAAAGSFESAVQLLVRQVGLSNPEPLKAKFLQIYQASRTFLPIESGLPPLEIYIRRDDEKKSLPRLPWNFEHIKNVQLREATKLVTANKLEQAVPALRDILHTLLLFAASSQAEADDVAKTVETIREYIIGLSVEIQRRGIDTSTPEGIKRNLELAAYFTHFQMSPQHRGLAYIQAMTQFNKYKNTATAGEFAQKYIALGIGRSDYVEKVLHSAF